VVRVRCGKIGAGREASAWLGDGEKAEKGRWMEGSEGEGWVGVTCDASCDYSPPFFDQGSYAAATMAVEVLLEDGGWKEGARSFVACRTSARPLAGAY
jgi:hypothetical protein